MKRISFIISMLIITILSINAQDCFDYTESNGTDNFPGIYGGEDYTIVYDGSNQIVELGVYGFFNDWWSPSQADETFFSVNGSESIALSELSDYQTDFGGVFATLNPQSLNDEYLASSEMDWTSGTVKFVGAIESITMTQFESGLLFSCVEILEVIEGCDYQFVGDDPGFEGYIVTGTYPFNFSGEEQVVSIGYFDYNPFEGEGAQYQDDSFFSVNGSELFDLHTIYNNQPFMIGDVSITIDTTSIPESYNVPSNMISGTIHFEGEIDLIVTSQVESGIKFICVGANSSEQDCEDYTIENEHINYPGIYNETVDLIYDGSGQTIELGIYGNFNDWDISPYTSSMFGTTIAVNGGSPVPIYSIIATGDYNMTDVTLSLDPASLNSQYLPNATVSATSGKIYITGFIESVTVILNGAGLFYSCAEPNNFIGDCEDLTLTNGTLDFPGIYGEGDEIRTFDGSNQSVNMGIYGLFTGWVTGGQQDETFFSVNGSEPVSLLTLSVNVNYNINDVVINLDTTAVDESYFSENGINWTSGVLNFSGPIETIVMTQMESGLLYVCTTPLANNFTTCDDFTVENNDPNQPGIYQFGPYNLDYDGTNQHIALGIYGGFNFWNTYPNLGQADDTYFSVNGNDPISLETIFNNAPYEADGIVIDLNTTFLGGEFPLSGTWTSGTVIFEGAIESISMIQFESGLLFSCAEPIAVQEDCIDFTVENDDPNAPGIYLIEGDYTLDYDSAYQDVSLGIYGFFDWSNIGSQQADQTLFSVNGSGAVSLEEIYLNQPYVVNDVEIIVDTTAINGDYPLADFWPSGTIIFSGHIHEIVMTQFESGLIFSCANPSEECDCEECACQIDADFTFVNINNYFSFVSSGTGTEFEWDFGDGTMSQEENPAHEYNMPDEYQVCLTNFNLTDTCSITICKTITSTDNTPAANIITPNNDGYDDELKINCNHITVYNRNGIIVAELFDQEYWDGNNNMSVALPMGEYILKCNENDVIRSVTIIR